MQTYGHCSNEEALQSQEGLTLVFSPRSMPLKKRWRNNALSADFMADYFATFFPGEETSAPKAEVKAAVSYIANELIENSMKYSDTNADFPISLRLSMRDGALLFLSTHQITSEQLALYDAFAARFIASDPHSLLLEQAQSTSSTSSGLGLITLATDYGALLGWKFEPRGSSAVATTFVELSF